MFTNRQLLGIATVAAVLITGCSAEGEDQVDANGSPGTEVVEPAQTDTGNDLESPDDADEEPESTADAAAMNFRADSLHDGVEPAAAGTAYIEAGGERFEFSDFECRIEDNGDEGIFELIVQEETHEGPTELRVTRNIGPEGWAYVEELVQLTFVGGTEDRELNSISMAQLNIDESGSDVDWLSGDGSLPLVHVVDNQATATGTLGGAMFADDPAEGSFTAAINCG